ncbi:MAG: RHS repeat-associated core domain-containing protein [bacterium]|nr:RHS repeat-associated core domain-containing protein [bacterium]
MRELDINSTMELSFNCCENLVKAGIIERPDQLDDCDYYVYDSDEMRTRKVSERFANGGAVTQIEEKIYIGNFEIKRIKSVNAEGEEYLNHERQTLRVMDDDTCVTIFHNIKRDNQHQDKEGTQQCRFQLANHLGSISLELDNETQLISYEEYFPYGGTALTVGKNETEVRQKDYRYSGKERDDSTGMYYYGARYYAPWQARWLKPDAAGTVGGLNLYAFVGGNPVTNQELDGNMYCEKTKHGADILNIKKKVGSFLDQEEIETGRMALYNRVKDLTGTDAETTEYQEPLYGALRKFLKYSKNWVKVTDSESFREITTMKTHKFIINAQLNQKIARESQR